MSAVVDEHAHELLHEQRVALGGREHALAQQVGHDVAPSCHEHQLVGAAAASGSSRSVLGVARRAADRRAPLEQLGARRADEQERHATQSTPRYSMRSSSVSSAQCTSSRTTTSGRRRASASKSRRIAQNVSSSATGSPGRPSAGASRSSDLAGALLAARRAPPACPRATLARVVLVDSRGLSHGLARSARR